MSKLANFERSLNRCLEWALTLLFFAFFAVVAVLVVLRYLFNTSLIGAHEAVLIGFVYSTALGSAVAVSRGEHIAVTYFVEKLPPSWQLWIQCAVLALIALVNALMCWHSVFWIGRTGAFVMPALQWPQYVAQLSIPLGCGLAILFCFSRSMALLGPGPGPRDAGSDGC